MRDVNFKRNRPKKSVKTNRATRNRVRGGGTHRDDAKPPVDSRVAGIRGCAHGSATVKLRAFSIISTNFCRKLTPMLLRLKRCLNIHCHMGFRNVTQGRP